MSNLLILKNSDNKIPYINRGGTKYFINYSNEAVRLANDYLNKVYSYPQSVIHAGIQNFSNIAFNPDGTIDNTTNWYDYDIAKNVVIDIFEDIINNKGGFNTLLLYLDYRGGIQLNYVTTTWRIQKVFNFCMSKGDVYQFTSTRQIAIYSEAFNFREVTGSGKALNWDVNNYISSNTSLIVKSNFSLQEVNVARYLAQYRFGAENVALAFRRLTAGGIRTTMVDSDGAVLNRDSSSGIFVSSYIDNYIDYEVRVLTNTTTLQILINNSQVYISTNFNADISYIKTGSQLKVGGALGASEMWSAYIKTFQLNSY
jgi:hypothetical protein